MIDWYYHDPSEGRLGPYSAEDMRKRYRDRRIQRDTLVWRHGLHEWQPLDRVSEEIDLDDVVLDASQPPPLPPQSGTAPSYASTHPVASTRPAGKYSRVAAPPKKTLSGGAIVAIVLAALAIPVLGILAAIALPAYQDYATRANSSGALTGMAIALKRNVAEYAFQTGTCPSNDNPRVAQLARLVQERTHASIRFGTLQDQGCIFELTLHGLGPDAEGKTLRYEGYPDGNEFAWDCSGGSHRFDAGLRRQDLIVASHHDDRSKFHSLCQVHGADRQCAVFPILRFVQNLVGHINPVTLWFSS